MANRDVKLFSTNGNLKKINNRSYTGQPVTETLTNGFFTVDRDWTVKYWNKEAEKLLGVAAADIVGKNIWEKFAGFLPIEFYTVYYKAFLQDIPIHFEEYWGEMGAWFDVITYHCEDTLSVSFKSSNYPHPEYPDSAVQRLKILTELYKYVTEITNDCLWEWNLVSGELFWIDGGHKRVFGYNIENALIPQSFWESLLHPDEKVRILKKFRETIESGTIVLWEEQYRFKKANGDYAWVCDRGHIIYNEENVAVRIIGATQDITEKILLEDKLSVERLSRQREITEAVLTAQESERASIGAELHDNLNQILAVAKMNIQQAMTPGKNGEMYLAKTVGLIGDVMTEIRNIAKRLIIPPTHIMSLQDNINNLLHDLKIIHRIKFEVKMEGIDTDKMDEKLQTNIFRIIQEQVNNILTHSKASHASIHLKVVEDVISLVFSDNGKGCDTALSCNGVGIRNIRSRAELYNGTVSIISKAGKGFKLKVFLFPDWNQAHM